MPDHNLIPTATGSPEEAIRALRAKLRTAHRERDEYARLVGVMSARAVEANSGRILLAVVWAFLEHRLGDPHGALARLRAEADRQQLAVNRARAEDDAGRKCDHDGTLELPAHGGAPFCTRCGECFPTPTPEA